MKLVAAIAVALLLSGCATPGNGRLGSGPNTPLHDFNLAAIAIPPVLRDARAHPYALPPDLSCAELATYIIALDDVLGPDIDAPANESSAGDMVGDAATSAFQGMLDGLVPFRHWVRRLSGADQHARDITASLAAGSARRAFLKGVSLARACPAQAVASAESGPAPR